jgi:inhibitor of cysteine peptidase
MKSILILALALATSQASCASADDSTITRDGTVRFQEIEGGCWSIVATDSTVYEPLNLGEDFRQDGLAVSFVARPRPEMASICMVGQIVELVSIRRR